MNALTPWSMVIRPPRAEYNVKCLGPSVFHLDGVVVTREDIQLRTSRGLRLECSHFKPTIDMRRHAEPSPVVIYLHGNASNRLEAFQVLRPLLVRRIAVFCYDAAGCGMSEGDQISLGWFERDDLASVIEHLRKSPLCGAIGLWGRSMGAATALLHSSRDQSIAAICADSAFASLPELMCDIAQKSEVFQAPVWLTGALTQFVRMRVQGLASFDTHDVVPLDHVRVCHIPALYIHSLADTFIPMKHSRKLFEEHAGAKEFMEMAGDHNSVRGRVAVKHVVNYFCKAFHIDPNTPRSRNRLPFRDVTNIIDSIPRVQTPPLVRVGMDLADAEHADALPWWVHSHLPLVEYSFEAEAVPDEALSLPQTQSPRLFPPTPRSDHDDADKSGRSTPRTPTRVPSVACGDVEGGEMITPPAVEFAKSPESRRKACEGRQRRRRDSDSKSQRHRKHRDLENVDPQTLERVSAAVELEDALCLLKDFERNSGASLAQPSPSRVENCEDILLENNQDIFLDFQRKDFVFEDPHMQEVQDVYPTMSPAFLMPQRPQPPRRSKPTPFLHQVNITCCGDLTASMFGNCLGPNRSCESSGLRPCWIVSV